MRRRTSAAEIGAHWAERHRLSRLGDRQFHIRQWEARRLRETRDAAARFRNGMGAASFKGCGRTPLTLRLSRGFIRALRRDNMPRAGDWECNAAFLFRARAAAEVR